jgi:predicted nucleic acid-binding protein
VIVLDTNVTSELMRPAPDASVRAWVLAAPPADLFTTAITLAEVGYGIERLPEGRRRDRVRDAAEDVFATFASRVLPFDDAAAGRYAVIVDRRERSGRPIRAFDAQIASICRSVGASLATRNTRDFTDTGIDLIDPWAPA